MLDIRFITNFGEWVKVQKPLSRISLGPNKKAGETPVATLELSPWARRPPLHWNVRIERDARRYIGTFVLSETPATTLELSPGRDVRRYIGTFVLSETSAAALYFVLLWRSETLVSVLRE